MDEDESCICDEVCFCDQVGPLLVAPGTSGRSWRCGTCGRVWTPASPDDEDLTDPYGEKQ